MLTISCPVRRSGRGRLDELDEDPSTILGVGEVHEGPGGPTPRRVVEHADTCSSELLGGGNDVIDPVGDLLNAGP